MINLYFEPFIIPFTVGMVVLFGFMWTKFISWISALPKSDKKLIIRNSLNIKIIFEALWEAFSECLLHLRMRGNNIRLWYMHMSLAFGWFLLIVVGKIEGTITMRSLINPPYVDVFFRRYFPYAHIPFLGFLMDLLLLFILTGLAAAITKRFRPSFYGIKQTTKHTLGDKLALSSLWLIFPIRLLAESFNSALYDSGSFLTGSIGLFIGAILPQEVVVVICDVLWWSYSIVLGLFLSALPFSRYLHIFAEIPLIFLRSFKVRAAAKPTTFSKLQIAACSRCGICIDPCPLSQNNITHHTQSVYMLREARQNASVELPLSDSCLMCGRCQKECPVNIELDTIRTSERYKKRKQNDLFDYKYATMLDRGQGEGTVGYFAGCMGRLTPTVSQAMQRIAKECGIELWLADMDGGMCCGRPQKMAGNIDAAEQMILQNKQLFYSHKITTLVTSCPICLKVFKEDYALDGIRLMHHSEFIDELIVEGKLKVEKNMQRSFVYHDPCELGRGLNIYSEPRHVLQSLGELREGANSKQKSDCCGGSLAHTKLDIGQRKTIAKAAAAKFESTGAQYLVTSCPLCKKSFSSSTNMKVIDISEAIYLQ